MEKSTNNELRDKAFACAVKHGWHDKELPDTHWVMMIITEIAEAVQADRHEKHARREEYNKNITRFKQYHDVVDVDKYTAEAFEIFIKDSFEDELADICIRCYDLAGLRNFNFQDVSENEHDSYQGIKKGDYDTFLNLPVPQFMSYIIHCIDTTYTVDFDMICFAMYMIAEYAAKQNIPLLWHIEEKMKYNENRPYKHNRKY